MAVPEVEAHRMSETLPGVEIRNMTAVRLRDGATRSWLYQLWIREGLLIFPDFSGTAEQVELSEIFGRCSVHHARENLVEEYPQLINIRHRPHDGNVYDVDGLEVGSFLPWHSDLIYLDRINRGGVLRALEVSPDASRTGYIDKIAAYERLPDDLKQEIQGLNVVYKFDMDIEGSRFGNPWNARTIRLSPGVQSIQSRRDQYPRAVHPLCFAQKETGRMVLNVSPWFALGIQGMEHSEGDELLRRVISVATDERFAYYHQWTGSEMVLWDNWRMLHRASGMPAERSRWLQRTTIDGDYGMGALENGNAGLLAGIDV